MITYRSLKARLTAILKETFPGYKVYFDNVEKSDAPYFYVEMTPLRTGTVDGDGVYHDRAIDLDIQLVLAADKHGRVDRVRLYDAAATAGRIEKRAGAAAQSVTDAGKLIDQCQQIVGTIRNRGPQGTPAH